MKIVIDNLKFCDKCVKISYLVDNVEFYSHFEDALIQYLRDTSCGENDVCKALKHLMANSIFNFADFLKEHSYEDHIKMWNTSGYFVWKNKEVSNYMKGTQLRGKKQSKEWMESMKIWSKTCHNNRTAEHKDINAKNNKSIDFKKKYLINRQIDITNKNEEAIIKMYGAHLSMVRKSSKYKISCINKFINGKKYIGEKIFDEFRQKYFKFKIDDTNYSTIYPEMMSIISTIAMRNNENMGSTKFFKTGYKKVEYCKNKTIIRYRSSWELMSIEFLELNKIYYEYESFYIPRIDGKVYLPDFLIEIDKQLILLEIKGFVRGTNGKDNEKIKIESAKKYCEQNNMRYVYLTTPLSSIKQLIN